MRIGRSKRLVTWLRWPIALTWSWLRGVLYWAAPNIDQKFHLLRPEPSSSR
jgi:hypothetical protein